MNVFKRTWKKVTGLFDYAGRDLQKNVRFESVPQPVIKAKRATKWKRRSVDGVIYNSKRLSKAFRHCRTQCAGMR